MIKFVLVVTLLVTLFSVTLATSPLNPTMEAVFQRIYNVSDTVLTRLEKQTAEKQEHFLTVTLSFTLFECVLLVTSLILHVVSVVVLKHSRILPS